MEIKEKVDNLLCGKCKKKRKYKPNKKHLAGFGVFFGLCLVVWVIFSNFPISMFSRKEETEDIQPLDTNIPTAGDEQWNSNGSVYFYENWTAPPESFGIKNATFKFLNTSWFQGFTNKYLKTLLRASFNNETWYNASQGLTTIYTWNEDNDSVKISWILNTTEAPDDMFYQLYIGLDKKCQNFINGSINNYTVTFEVPNLGSDNATLNIVFNFTDIVNLIQSGKVWFTKGIKTIDNQTFFYGKIQTKDKLPNTIKNFTIDPTFGETGTGTGNLGDFADTVIGSPASPASDGVANNITLYCRPMVSGEHTCGLFDNTTNELVAQTEEIFLTATGGFYSTTFDFASGPSISSGTDYKIMAWADNSTRWRVGAGTIVYRYGVTYNGTLPDDLDDYAPPNTNPYILTIYCSYTEGGEEEVNQTQNIFNNYWTSGNATPQTQSIFSNYWTSGNVSSTQEIFSNYWTSGNVTVTTDNIFNNWWTSGNTTPEPNATQNIFNNWWTSGNISISTSSIFNNYWTSGNVSIDTTNIFTNWWTSGNVTVSTTNIFNHWWTSGNTTPAVSVNQTQNIFTNWWTSGNQSPTQQIFSHWWTSGNTTSLPVTITNEYPANQSNITSLQPTLYFTLNSSNGSTMDYYVYNGSTLLFSGTSVSNGTYSGLWYNVTNYTRYNWSVCVEVAGSWTNETYYFNAKASGGGIRPTTSPVAIALTISLIVGLFGGIIGVMIFRRKKEGYVEEIYYEY
jgi:hypothetical protein